MATIKLLTNVPAVGTVQYLDFYAAKPNPKEPGKTMGPDLGLKGTFNGETGTIYVSAALLQELLTSGMATCQGYDASGAPVGLKWVYAGPVHILKAEQPGSRRKITTITPANGAPAPVAPVPAVAPPHPAAAPAGVVAQSAPAPAPHPAAPAQTIDREAYARGWWKDQYRCMRFCLEQAYAVHLQVSPESAHDHQAVGSTAHSFYIQANRDKVLAAPKAKAVKEPAPSAPEPLPANVPTPRKEVAHAMNGARSQAGPALEPLDDIPEALEEVPNDDLPF